VAVWQWHSLVAHRWRGILPATKNAGYLHDDGFVKEERRRELINYE
jgi:hypothetical protein